MKLIYCSTGTSSAGDRLHRIVESFAVGMTLEIYQDFHGLFSRLCQPKYDVAVAVLFAGNRKMLLDLLSIRDLLLDLRIILIIPERDDQTMALGRKLFPRFVSYADSNFSDVGAVLEKMIANIRDGEKKSCQLTDRMQIKDPEGCPT